MSPCPPCRRDRLVPSPYVRITTTTIGALLVALSLAAHDHPSTAAPALLIAAAATGPPLAKRYLARAARRGALRTPVHAALGSCRWCIGRGEAGGCCDPMVGRRHDGLVGAEVSTQRHGCIDLQPFIGGTEVQGARSETERMFPRNNTCCRCTKDDLTRHFDSLLSVIT